jgi:CRISPR-associated protein Cas1
VIQALCEADIPVTYFSMGGWFYGMTRGHSLKNAFTLKFAKATASICSFLCLNVI